MSSLSDLYRQFASRGLTERKKSLEAASKEVSKSKQLLASLRLQYLTQRLSVKAKQQLLAQIRNEAANLKHVSNVETNLNTLVQERNKEIGNTASKIDAVVKPLERIGQIGMSAFGAATAGMLGLLKAAAPVDLAFFNAELTILAMNIGRIFIPILRDAENAVKSLSAWFRNLTAEERQQIRDWTRLGLKVLASMAAFYIAGKIVSGLVGMFKGLSAAVKGVLAGIELYPKMMYNLGAAIRTVWVAIKSLWALAAAHPFLAIASAIALVVVAVQTLSGVFGSVGKQIADARAEIQRLQALLEKLGQGGTPTSNELRDTLREEDYRRLAELQNDKPKQIEHLQQIKRREEERLRRLGVTDWKDEGEVERRATTIQEAAKTDTSAFGGRYPFWTTDKAETLKNELGQRFQGMGLNLEEQVKQGRFPGPQSAYRAAERFGNIRSALEQKGVNHEAAGSVAAEVLRGLGGSAGSIHLSEEETKKAADALRAAVHSAKAQVEVADKGIKQGGYKFERVLGTEKKTEDDAPRLPARQAEMGNIADAWKKAQLAVQGENPELRIWQERMLQQGRDTQKASERGATAAEETARNTRTNADGLRRP